MSHSDLIANLTAAMEAVNAGEQLEADGTRGRGTVRYDAEAGEFVTAIEGERERRFRRARPAVMALREGIGYVPKRKTNARKRPQIPPRKNPLISTSLPVCDH